MVTSQFEKDIVRVYRETRVTQPIKRSIETAAKETGSNPYSVGLLLGFKRQFLIQICRFKQEAP